MHHIDSINHTFAFALGNSWKWMKTENRAELLKYIKRLDVAGVELTMATKEELYAFRLTKEQVRWLRGLDYVSIHAPFGIVRCADDEKEIIRQLGIIQKLYDTLMAKTVIIHSSNLPSPQLLKRYHMHFSIENLPKKRHFDIGMMKRIIAKYPGSGLCLDVAHAYLWSRHETERYIRAFKGKIDQVHFSGTYRKKDHRSLQEVSPLFLKSVELLKTLDVPIVIEEGMEDNGMDYAKKEVEYIKGWFAEDLAKKGKIEKINRKDK
jgi:sugar phosphate isomerase/epimerase